MSIQHYFNTRKVEMSDSSDLWEIVTPRGERVVSATDEETLIDIEMALNLALTDAADADADIVVNN